MKTIKILFVLSMGFLSLAGNLPAQTIQISGTVRNKEMKTPVSMAHIFTKDRSFGTVSTVDGKFSLKIPVTQSNTYLYFSNIGYETDSLLISQTNVSPTVYLMPKVYTLREVIVMPDSTLRTLLRKAYAKIPENYPQQPTRYTGFYQESTSDHQDSLIKLVEAELSVYKESYNRAREAPGQVEILKSRLIHLQSTNIGSIGGAFTPVDDDLVLQRSVFIQPENLKYFHYELIGIKSWNGKECYEITFRPLGIDSVRRGTMLIDVESLAYISFETQSERPENANSIGIINAVESKRIVEYEPYNGLWYLKYVSARSRFENWRLKNPQTASYDYITTQIQTDSVSPIPVEQRLKYMDPIEAKAEKYNPKGWTDSELLDNEDPEQLRFQFSTDEASSVFKQNVKTGKTYAPIRANLFSKLIAGYGAYYNPDIRLAVLQQVAGYRLNNKWSVQGIYTESFYDKTRTSFWEINLGVEYRKNLNKAGYPLYVETSLWLSHNHIEQKFHPLIRKQAVIPQLSLSKQANQFFTFEVFVNCPIVLFSNSNKPNQYHQRVGLNLYFLY